MRLILSSTRSAGWSPSLTVSSEITQVAETTLALVLNALGNSLLGARNSPKPWACS